MATDEYAILLAKIEDQQSQLTEMSAGHEALTRQAYQQAADDINLRMADLIESRGGIAELSPRDRFRLTRDTGMLEQIDGRLAELGTEHTNIVINGFQEGGTLARAHLGDELAALVTHANSVSGTALPVAAAIDFAKLDTTAIELGLGTAMNDVTALNQATRVTMKREITAGMVAGESIRDLSARIDGLEDISRNRAEVITRWSATKSYNLAHQATYEAAEQSIPGLRKMWLTQTDERTCPHCLAQNGIVVDVVDDFDPNLTYAGTPPEPYQGFMETPPLHPRCRCTITSWHESWRAYTTRTPEELNADARDQSIAQGHPKATTAGITGVAPLQGAEATARNALGDIMQGVFVFNDTGGTVKVAAGDILEARLALRNAGFRVSQVDDTLLKFDFPRGLALPRTIRSTKLKALSPHRWDEIKRGLRQCGLKI